VVLSVCDLSVRDHVEQHHVANVFLLLLAGVMVGYLTRSLVGMAVERDAALRAAAVAEERSRLARAVHDGVLQVLALAQRRGREPGGDAELGRLAGDQEERLRALIRSQDTLGSPTATADLAVALQALATARVSVASAGDPVPMDAQCVAEVVAAVGACLDNVRRHVGADAPAWILVDDGAADEVVVTVRDEGGGIPAGRLDEAAGQGRLGVVESIRGRLRDLGGEARLVTAPTGTEWELVVPRRVRV
jgi:signal transduction histidine kinase